MILTGDERLPHALYHLGFLAGQLGRLLTTSTSLFFFQAEDGIRDPLVTGVQKCALPISYAAAAPGKAAGDARGFSSAARAIRIATSPRRTCPSPSPARSAARRSSSSSAQKSAPCTPA